MTPIFITSWERPHFLLRTVRTIRRNTAPGTFSLHVWDNGSGPDTIKYLKGIGLDGLYLSATNTGVSYPKGIFQAMAVGLGAEYYCVTDDDVLPSPGWLPAMIDIMDGNPNLALLTLRLPPESLQGPLEVRGDHILCRAVGNTFKVVRSAAWPQRFVGRPMEWGDDTHLSERMRDSGWDVAFCTNHWCLHLGQCDGWGYTTEMVAADPRKKCYGAPYVYPYNKITYEPV